MRAWVFLICALLVLTVTPVHPYSTRSLLLVIISLLHVTRCLFLHIALHYTQEVGEDFRTSLDGRIERALSQQAWQALAQVLQTRSDSKVRHGHIRLTATAEPSPSIYLDYCLLRGVM